MTAWVEGQNRGRLGEIRDVGENESEGRTHRMDKTNTETNSNCILISFLLG